mgnify:CR=1 FL=1
MSIKEELNSQEFIDYVFNLPSPIVYPSRQDNKSAMDGDVEFEYKYPLHGFEDLISEPDYPESSIINYYSYYVSTGSDGNRRPLKKQAVNHTFEVGPVAETQELWADAKNYFFDSYYTGFNSPYDNLIKKDLLPFYANVKIESLSPKSEELSGNIIRRGIPYPTCQYVSDLIAPDGDFSFFDTVNFSNTNIQPEYRDETQTSFIEKKFIENQNIKLIDVYEMLNNIYTEASVNSSPPSQYIYRPSPPQTTTTKSIINANIQDFLEEVNSYEPRKYEEMLSGNLSPQSGVLFYKISKFSSDNPDVPLNSVWVPANNDKNKDIILNYVDSQVKYGKRYFYQVFAYKIVVGSVYSYGLENYVKEDDVIINPVPPKTGTLPPGDIVVKIDPPTKGTARDDEEPKPTTRRVFLTNKDSI